jgi:hypothetical protein
LVGARLGDPPVDLSNSILVDVLCGNGGMSAALLELSSGSIVI